MKRKTQEEYKMYTIENGVQINVPIANENMAEIEQQLSYQKFINVLSNIVTKYMTEDESTSIK